MIITKVVFDFRVVGLGPKGYIGWPASLLMAERTYVSTPVQKNLHRSYY